ncbi:MAG: hypothetical protein IIA59_06720 [Candidatus Marinimicrobia bacterium]|nr:hypothetical protein [Candidatus Neomarinimicrobiota bacterium]
MPFRRDDRDFSEGLFKNAQRQEANGSLGAESLKEFLIDPRSGEVFPIKFENVSLQIDQNGFPISTRERGIVVLDCGHKPCSLSQVLGRCQQRGRHLICDKCSLYTCALNGCGLKICDLDVLRLEDGSTICIEHEDDLIKEQRKTRLLRGFGDTLLYLCGWDGQREDE